MSTIESNPRSQLPRPLRALILALVVGVACDAEDAVDDVDEADDADAPGEGPSAFAIDLDPLARSSVQNGGFDDPAPPGGR